MRALDHVGVGGGADVAGLHAARLHLLWGKDLPLALSLAERARKAIEFILPFQNGSGGFFGSPQALYSWPRAPSRLTQLG